MVTDTPPTSGPPSSVPATGATTAGVRPVTTVTAGTLIMDTYEIEKLINSGGMGEVYRGRNIHNGEPVAIKIVLPSLAHDPKIVALFQKESTVLSRLNHDAIVRYHTFTIDRAIGRPCMVMEFVSGTPLGDRVEQGPMPLDEVKIMFRRVAGGLDRAHRAGVVHRDLSPDNVILEEGSVEHAKLIDFGIAKSTNIGGGTLLGGQFAGKFNWVSPEQLGAFGGHVDGRSDIYSTALLIAAASRGAVVPMGASIVDAVGKRSGVPDLTGVDPELLPLLSYMLQPDPANRPESMAAVIAALDNPALIPVADPGPPPADPNRTVIGGMLPPQPVSVPPVATATPLAAPQAMPVAAPLPPARPVSAAPVAATPVSAAPVAGAPSVGAPSVNDWGVPGAAQSVSPATIISVQPVPQTPPPEPEDISPFGAPSAPAAAKPAAVVYDPLPVAKKGKGGLVAVLALLVIAAGAGGAVLTGVVDPAALFGAAKTPEQLAAAEAARVAEQEAAAIAAADAAAIAAAEAELARAAAAEAEAAKALTDAKAAEEAATIKAAADAAAAKSAEAEAAAAKQAEADAAKAAEAEAAAKTTAEQQAAADAAAKAATEAAALKATQDADAAKAAAAAKLAEDQAAAAAKAAEEETARAKAAALAGSSDPIIKQMAWVDGFAPPACVHVRMAAVTDIGLRLDGFATSTTPLEAAGADYKAAVGTDANMAVRLINDTQCAILDFAGQTRVAAKDSPVIRMDNPNEAIKSGATVSGVIDGLKGRPFTLLLVSEEGVTSTLQPYVTVASDGAATFRLALNLPEGRPPAPHLLLAVVTDAELPVLGQLKPDKLYSATLLMPFLSKKLQDAGLKAETALGFFRLEN